MASKFSQGTGFLYNLLTLLSGFTLPIGHYIYNRATGNAPSLKEQVSSDIQDYKDTSAGGFFSNLFDSDPLSNWMNQNFGTGLTQRDKEVMAWNKEQTDIAWNRELEASNTAMQRKVADYQAAGVNPMLAGEGGVSLPSAVAANVSPSAGNFQLDSLLRLIEMANMLPIQKEIADAQVENVQAQTAKMKNETETETVRRQQIKANIDEVQQEIRNMIATERLTEAQTEKLNKDIVWLDRLNQAVVAEKESNAALSESQKHRIDALLVGEKLIQSKTIEDFEVRWSKVRAEISKIAAEEDLLVEDLENYALNHAQNGLMGTGISIPNMIRDGLHIKKKFENFGKSHSGSR